MNFEACNLIVSLKFKSIIIFDVTNILRDSFSFRLFELIFFLLQMLLKKLRLKGSIISYQIT